jgi:hypothetical protein
MLGHVDSCPQLSELVLDLARSLAGRGADGCLLVLECVEMTLNPR